MLFALEIGSCCVVQVVLNLVWYFCLHLPNARITGMYHHAWLQYTFLFVYNDVEFLHVKLQVQYFLGWFRGIFEGNVNLAQFWYHSDVNISPLRSYNCFKSHCCFHPTFTAGIYQAKVRIFLGLSLAWWHMPLVPTTWVAVVGKLLELAKPVSLDSTMNPHLRSEKKEQRKRSAGVLETPTLLGTKRFPGCARL